MKLSTPILLTLLALTSAWAGAVSVTIESYSSNRVRAWTPSSGDALDANTAASTGWLDPLSASLSPTSNSVNMSGSAQPIFTDFGTGLEFQLSDIELDIANGGSTGNIIAQTQLSFVVGGTTPVDYAISGFFSGEFTGTGTNGRVDAYQTAILYDSSFQNAFYIGHREFFYFDDGIFDLTLDGPSSLQYANEGSLTGTLGTGLWNLQVYTQLSGTGTASGEGGFTFTLGNVPASTVPDGVQPLGFLALIMAGLGCLARRSRD